jgi:4-amino-4-deoxy-L-arabinose transferase-like glycosyltransferase/predicted RNA-binding Zn-ribbon protein involved in translation (DUF1610 family)
MSLGQSGARLDDKLVQFSCPECGKKLKTKASSAGKYVKCPQCASGVKVPEPAPAESAFTELAPAQLPPAELPPEPIWRILLPPFLVALVLWATFGFKLYNLDHTALTRWDEVFHAVVARNVMKHPLTPTLVDVPYLPYDQTKWGENHVWLHKPILPFWQVAFSLALFGVNTFALRLPAAILSTGAALFTYLIGKELFDRRTGLIAATLQAINPFLMSLIHGYQFADNIDIALLFWIEAGMYCLMCALKTGAWRYVLLAGFCQGLAFLCKSYLAAVLFGVAMTGWLLPFVRLAPRDQFRIGVWQLLTLAGITIVTVAPWQIYCMIAFPEEYWHEHAQVWRHLYSNVEQWAAPWDRLLFDYLIAINGVFYTPILMAMIALFAKGVTERRAGYWLVLAWSLGVIVPHVFAVTKTPSATVLALPANLLLLGFLIACASRLERAPLIALTAILLMCLILPPVVRNPGHGYPHVSGFGGVMCQALWVLIHLGVALVVMIPSAAIAFAARRLIALEENATLRWMGRMLLLFCAGAMIWLCWQTIDAAWRVVAMDLNDPASVEVGAFVSEGLPDNAVLFCEQRKGYEAVALMFYTDRTCYPLATRNLEEVGPLILQNGGVPYVVTYRRLPLEVVHACRRGPTIYRWRQ